MSYTRLGFNPHRLITLIQQSIQRCELQLDYTDRSSNIYRLFD